MAYKFIVDTSKLRSPGVGEFYELAIAQWPRCPEGETPILASFSQALRDQDNPRIFGEHSFYFQSPPSRLDFVNRIRVIPWAASAYEQAIAEYLPFSEWPIVGAGRKGARADLYTEKGRRIGYIDVRRHDVALNEGYMQPSFYPSQHNFGNWVRERENLINEILSLTGVQGSIEDQAKTIKEIQKVLQTKKFTTEVKIPCES